MATICFHLLDEEEEKLRGRGVDPTDLAKELVLREIRDHDVGRTLEILDRYSKPPSRPVVETVREGRGTRG